MLERALNVQYESFRERINVTELKYLSEVKEKVKEMFEITRGIGYIQFYDMDNALIDDLDYIAGLYYKKPTEGGLSLTIKLARSPPSSQQASHANLLGISK
jgi:hypothetical protein